MKIQLILMMAFGAVCASAQDYAAKMVESHGKEWSQDKAWDYVSGLVAKSILKYCNQYPDDAQSAKAYGWCKTYADQALYSDGRFRNFKPGSLDNIASGKVLLDLYLTEEAKAVGSGAKYKVAADYLYNYIRYEYPRIELEEAKDCYIHKTSYPYQMWLDGLYMGAAYYAEYLSVFAPDDAAGWSDIALQFKTIHKHTYDPDKQLCYHGWSANPGDANSFWAKSDDPFRGCSSEFWGRGMGWYCAALVDVLELMPTTHPDREAIAEIYTQVMAGICRWQDDDSGVWYQLMQYDDRYVSAGGNRNYLEASASSMFTYSLYKGLRLGLIDAAQYRQAAERAYAGLVKTFISDKGKYIDINNICRSAGLGPASNRQRDGSADYYLDGSDVYIVSNEGKGIGSFIQASLEYELAVNTSLVTVGIDQEQAAYGIYDLQGRRVAHPGHGVYVRVGATGAQKVVY